MKNTGIPIALQEKKDQDFVEVSRRILEALVRIENDHEIKATQDALAQLAKCSRGTLNNRQWPLDRLRQIKDARNTPKPPVHDESTSAVKVQSRIDRYKEQLYNSREELLIWKAHHDVAKGQLSDALNLNQLLQNRLKGAEEEIAMFRRNSIKSVVKLTSKPTK